MLSTGVSLAALVHRLDPASDDEENENKPVSSIFTPEPIWQTSLHPDDVGPDSFSESLRTALEISVRIAV